MKTETKIMKFYTTKEVAELLKVHPRTIIKYIADKILKASKVGVGWKINEDDLRAFLESRSNFNS